MGEKKTGTKKPKPVGRLWYLNGDGWCSDCRIPVSSRGKTDPNGRPKRDAMGRLLCPECRKPVRMKPRRSGAKLRYREIELRAIEAREVKLKCLEVDSS
jgi:hypothetical protein